MTLPPWTSDDPVDQRSLTAFIIRELDAADAREARSAADDSDKVSYLTALIDLRQRAAQIGVPLALPATAKRRGPKARNPLTDFTPFDWAARDVPRIRALFFAHWRKRNRTKRPLAEEIAAERWGLDKDDTGRLIDKFQRKS